MKNNWQTKKLKDIADMTYGKNLPTSRFLDKGYPVFGANGIIGKYNKYLYETPKLLVSCRGANSGNINISPPESYITNNSIILNLFEEDEIERRFYYYQLSIVNKSKIISGSAQPQVTIANLSELAITEPNDKKIKSTIAQTLDSLFSKIDAGEEGLKKVEKQLEAYKQSILKLLFEKENLIAIRDLITDIRYGTSKKSDYGLGEIPVLRIPNINVMNRTLDDKDLKTSELSDVEHEKLRLKEGDILIIRSNGSIDLIGRSAVVTQKYINYAFAGYLIRLKVDKTKVLSEYLSLALSTPFVRNQIQQKGKSTSGVNNINSQEIQDLNIPHIPLKEQSKVVENMKKTESIINYVRKAIIDSKRESKLLRQSILKKAFSGELI
jgi:type I restriction enzyme, S subunit